MLPERADIDPWALFIAITALLAALWIARSVVAPHQVRRAGFGELAVLALAAATVGGAVFGLSTMLAPLACFLALALTMYLAAPKLSVPGIAWLAISFNGVVIGWFWSCLFIAGLDLPFALKAVALTGTYVTLSAAILGTAERVAREAVMTHRHWRLPTRVPLLAGNLQYEPKVSIHLPCYAEPPEIVMATMDRLAALDYADFEVLVCDNNTRDEALWRPLEHHAAVLNARLGLERFRFHHVAPLAGAKAGALNFLMGETDPAAELVAVVDADYFAEPDFLARLVPFFANPNLAYLQTPHDYRDFAGNPYLSACYSEYMPNNKIDMLGVHEYGGAFTIGTMCLLRLRPLQAVGGWAEWCLTEDSEVSVRLRAAGYHGLYLGETFGRGLIPATFDDYKKQRFRWTAGPVQQLRRHWRKFLPTPWARSMPGWTKLLEFARCVAPLQALLQLVTGMLVVTGTALAVYLGVLAPIVMPPVVWLLLLLAGATRLVRTWHRYRLVRIRRIGDMVRGEIARSALAYVVLVGGVAGLSRRPLAWRRTPKFSKSDTLWGALASALPETMLGILFLLAAALFVQTHVALGWQFALLAAGGLAALGLRFLCAPYMAVLARRSARREARDIPEDAPGYHPLALLPAE